jgi:hypothetical protein
VFLGLFVDVFLAKTELQHQRKLLKKTPKKAPKTPKKSLKNAKKPQRETPYLPPEDIILYDFFENIVI